MHIFNVFLMKTNDLLSIFFPNEWICDNSVCDTHFIPINMTCILTQNDNIKLDELIVICIGTILLTISMIYCIV